MFISLLVSAVHLWRCSAQTQRGDVGLRGQAAPLRRSVSCARHNCATLIASPPAVYRIWRNMIARCQDPNNKGYKDCGGRGIAVCDSWRNSFEAFFAAMGHCPPGRSLARRNSDKGYEPGNCYWATRAEQRRNARNVRTVTLDGEPMCLKDAAKALGISQGALSWRVRYHKVTFQEAVDYYIPRCQDEK
jgi:hypothetical protein